MGALARLSQNVKYFETAFFVLPIPFNAFRQAGLLHPAGV